MTDVMHDAETQARVAAHRAVMSASQQARDEAVRAELVLLRDERVRHLDEIHRLRAAIAAHSETKEAE